ncbi:MAG: cupin domain-containing protein [Marmoricola sp.]
MEQSGSRPWVRAGLTLALGAMVVFAVVAMVIPTSATDPSGLKGKAIAGSRLDGPIDLHTDGSSDVEIARLTIPSGGDGGWHEHRGYVLVSVLEGVATFYDQNDPNCTPHRYRAGEGVLESPHHPHITRNEGPQPLVLYVVAVTPHGKSSDKSEPASHACRF